MQDWIAERQALGLKASSIVRHLGHLSQVLHWARDIKNIDIRPELVIEARRRFLRHNPVIGRLRDRKDPKQKIGNNQVVPLLPAAMAIVRARRELTGGVGRIFAYRSAYISERWHQTTRYLEIDDLTFHDLRHAAITDLFRKGLDIPEVALVIGHRSWRELKRYTQLTAADVLGKFSALEQAGG